MALYFSFYISIILLFVLSTICIVTDSEMEHPGSKRSHVCNSSVIFLDVTEIPAPCLGVAQQRILARAP